MNVATALSLTQETLEAANIDSHRVESLVILEHLLGASRAEIVTNYQRPLSEVQRRTLDHWLARRTRREPLQHILGLAYFYGLELCVTPAVLIPRPETERLVELALRRLAKRAPLKVLDIGTGSGAIALAIKAERPNAEVVATDISEAALEVAQANATTLGLDIRFVYADLLEGEEVSVFAREADLIISNPPYLLESDAPALSPEVHADPKEALYSGEDGLTHFRRLKCAAHRLLKPGAWLFVELDPRNVRTAYDESKGWAQRWVEKDLVRRKRFLRLRR